MKCNGTSIEGEQEHGVPRSIGEGVDGVESRTATVVVQSALEVEVAVVESRRSVAVGKKLLGMAMPQDISVTVAQCRAAVAYTRVRELRRHGSSWAALDGMSAKLMVEVVAEEVLGRLASLGPAKALWNVEGRALVL